MVGGDLELAMQQALEEFRGGLADAGCWREDFAADAARTDVDREVWHAWIKLGNGLAERKRVEIRVRAGFPYRAPAAFPLSTAGSRWQRDRDGALCLWRSDAYEGLPWRDSTVFLQKVRHWLEQDELGWPDDEPVLDLDRYLPRASGRLILIESVSSLGAGATVRFTREPHDVLRASIVPGVPQRGRNGRSRDTGAKTRYGRVIDVGELAQPVHDWTEIKALLTPDLAERIVTDVRRGQCSLLLLRYARAGRTGVVALDIRAPAGRGGRTEPELDVSALTVADTGEEAISLRAGTALPVLLRKSVAVVGIGAIGSFLVDLLLRLGVGKITGVDGDVLKPGNCIRHLARRAQVGLSKPEAVKAHLIQAGRQDDARRFTADSSNLIETAKALELFNNHDLVVDASANGIVHAMLSDLARQGAGTVLSVVAHAQGRAIRVDRYPSLDPSLVPPVIDLPPLPEALAYEAGCAEPISMVSPATVMEAAALAARHTAAMLVEPQCFPAGEARRLDIGGRS
jgi:molybdopterin/thiamine biosynthesis adenylyltransferase